MNSLIRTVRPLLAAPLIGAALLAAAGASASHGVFANCVMTGPNWRPFAQPYAHVGDTVNVGFVLRDVCQHGDIVSVTGIRLAIHHASGTVTMTNLLASPITMSNFGTQVFVLTNFIVQPGDGEWLAVDWAVNWTDAPRAGVGSLSGTTQYRTHFQVLPAPALTVRRLGANIVRVSWPDTAPCRLEVCAGIGQPWTVCTLAPSRDAGECAVTVDCSTTSAQFFRLAPYESPLPGTSGGGNANAR